ncbi:MAG: ATP phosphoribosyltransferase [Candidatus Omnitrophica bacterium]|nr:ATP phosphoribosyltransferase [Candidatus Omnitrophota bacterium]
MSTTRLKIGLPKGSLQEATVRIFGRAGFRVSMSERSYFPSIDDAELQPMLFRAQEMAHYVEHGIIDCGITGSDWIAERGSKVQRICELRYAKRSPVPVRWVVAVPADGPIRRVRDLAGKRIATELVGVTTRYLRSHRVKAEVEFSWGATEAKVQSGLVDAIVEVTETGTTLAANGLRILDTVMASTTQFIANTQAWRHAWKRQKMETVALLLQGAVEAEGKVGVKLNVAKRQLSRILRLLPAMKRPTISALSDEQWVAVETIIDETVVRRLIPELKRAGASGIIEYPLNKVIP